MPRARTATKKQVIEPPSLANAQRVKPLSFSTALNQSKLFGPIFSDPSWDPWKTCAKAWDGEALTQPETEFFETISAAVLRRPIAFLNSG
jgi:hypothetical protein